jgi:truncated hemoglobin YjbI
VQALTERFYDLMDLEPDYSTLRAVHGPELDNARQRLFWFLVRLAWAHTCGCKSRRELITTNEVKRNCMRVTECGKEARSVNREPMNKNRI